MRETIHHQRPLMQAPVKHFHADELEAISQILDSNPEITDLVFNNILRKNVSSKTGSPGMSANQVLRALLVKQMNGFSYDELAFHLADSITYRRFCNLGAMDGNPSKSALQQNISRVTHETLEKINRIILRAAREKDVEKGRKVRIDCTVTETNIHPPSDSTLLYDCVRTLARLLKQAGAITEISFTNHTRVAKKRMKKTINTRGKEKRKALYQQLVRITKQTINYTTPAINALLRVEPEDGIEKWLAAKALADELKRYSELTLKVIKQTERRIFNDEKVPHTEKVVSIFEPHTNIIKKNNRDTEFGHKLCITSGKSSMILDVTIEDGNPADSTLAEKMVNRQEEIYGQVPRQVAFDGGFASKANLETLKDKGVSDVMFHKKCGLKISDMAKSGWVYKRLKNFRAGVEGVISFVKRCFGLSRCTWKGLSHFKQYVWGSVISMNLLTMARQLL